MESLPLWALLLMLFLCLLCSGFFSASETALMSINRYKLKFLVDEGNKAAKRTDFLLQDTGRLLGTILLGNNFVNILGTSLGTVIGIRLFGDYGVLVATCVLTVIILLFSEMAPKTCAALHPERVALPVSRVMSWCVWILSPLVWLLSRITDLLLRPLGVTNKNADVSLSNEELKTIVMASHPSSEESRERTGMLIGVLELEDASVDEVMVARNDIEGVDLNDSWEEILNRIMSSRHGRLPAYRDSLDKVEGMLHLRDVIALSYQQNLRKDTLIGALRECTFTPEGTSLRQQLLQFRMQHQRTALVVDEYGDIQGMITLEDILTYIVGDIDEEDVYEDPEIIQQGTNVFWVDGSMSIRVLNRELGLKLPIESANTVSGLIIETLGSFPEVGVEVTLENCTMRVEAFDGGVVARVLLTLNDSNQA